MTVQRRDKRTFRRGSDPVFVSLLFAVLLVSGMRPALLHAQETTETLSGLDAEKTFTMTFETDRSSTICYPTTTVEYQQHGPVAVVTGLMSVDDCAKASGEYIISVRVRDDDGNMKTIDFEEAWAREDQRPVSVAKDYPIGSGVDLVRVRFRSKTCLCADVVDSEEAQP